MWMTQLKLKDFFLKEKLALEADLAAADLMS